MKRLFLFLCFAFLFMLSSTARGADTFAGSTTVTDRHRVDHAPEVWHSYDTATGATAINETLAPGVTFQLLEVRVHLNTASATTENFVISIDGTIAADVYDCVLDVQDMNGVQDYIYRSDNDTFFIATDEVEFDWANSNSCTWGLEVLWQKTNK